MGFSVLFRVGLSLFLLSTQHEHQQGQSQNNKAILHIPSLLQMDLPQGRGGLQLLLPSLSRSLAVPGFAVSSYQFN